MTLIERITARLEAGESVDVLAADLGLEVGTIDGEPAIVLPGWRADDGNAEVEYPAARSGREAAEEYVADGDWNEVTETCWIRVASWRAGLYLEDGEACEGEVDGSREHHTIALDPEEPECTHAAGHDWQSPYELLGGCEENPGCWGSGGGIVINKVCAHCGAYLVTDTWAQNPETGEQGLTSIEYRPADDASLAWVEANRD